jgi:protein O-GlcNAc transferase
MPEENHFNMTAEELAFLQGRLSSSRRYLEFGAGTSTAMAVKTAGIESIDTVESSKPFIETQLLNQPALQEAVEASRLRIHWIDIGPTGDWGTPSDPATRHLWPGYSSRIFAKAAGWDLILIDGRFRVACCLNSILHTDPACLILIHDFSLRKEYSVVLEFLDIVDRLGTFVLLRRKKGIDTRKVEKLYEKYRFLPLDKTFSQRVRSFVGRRLGKLNVTR